MLANVQPQGGVACTRPTTTTRIPPGGMSGGLGEQRYVCDNSAFSSLPKRGKERKKDGRKDAPCNHRRSQLKFLGLHWSRGRAPNAGSLLRNKRHLYSTSSCQSGAQNMDGLMKGKHAQKKLSAVDATPPNPLSLKTQGGGVAYKDRAWPPPRGAS